MVESFLYHLFLVAITGVAIGFDIKEKRIPNQLILVAITGGILFNASQGVPQLKDSLLGLGLGVGFLIIPFVLGWMGAGDVKFLGAVGAILGVKPVAHVFFYSAILGGILALISAIVSGINPKAFKISWSELKVLILSRGAVWPEMVNHRVSKGARSIPFGVAIGLGTLVAVYLDPRGEWAGF